MNLNAVFDKGVGEIDGRGEIGLVRWDDEASRVTFLGCPEESLEVRQIVYIWSLYILIFSNLLVFFYFHYQFCKENNFTLQEVAVQS